MKKIIFLVFAVFVCCSWCLAEQDVERFVDDKGMTHFIGHEKSSEAKQNDNPSERPQDKYFREQQRFNDLAEQGKVVIGMSGIQVMGAWGSPLDINRTVTSGGVSEQWVYPGQSKYKNRYVYLENNIVTGFQD